MKTKQIAPQYDIIKILLVWKTNFITNGISLYEIRIGKPPKIIVKGFLVNSATHNMITPKVTNIDKNLFNPVESKTKGIGKLDKIETKINSPMENELGALYINIVKVNNDNEIATPTRNV